MKTRTTLQQLEAKTAEIEELRAEMEKDIKQCLKEGATIAMTSAASGLHRGQIYDLIGSTKKPTPKPTRPADRPQLLQATLNRLSWLCTSQTNMANLNAAHARMIKTAQQEGLPTSDIARAAGLHHRSIKRRSKDRKKTPSHHIKRQAPRKKTT